jgi:hypothetical protein
MKQVSLYVITKEHLFCIDIFCLDKGRTGGGLTTPLVILEIQLLVQFMQTIMQKHCKLMGIIIPYEGSGQESFYYVLIFCYVTFRN